MRYTLKDNMDITELELQNASYSIRLIAHTNDVASILLSINKETGKITHINGVNECHGFELGPKGCIVTTIEGD